MSKDFKVIYSNHKDLVDQLVKLGLVNYQLTWDEDNPYKFAANLLGRIQKENKPSLYAKVKLQRLKNNLDIADRCFVSGISYGNEGGIPQDSYRENAEEVRQIEIIKLERELRDAFIESQMLERQAADRKKLLETVIDILPNDTNKEVIKCMFLENLPAQVIAKEMNYDYGSIRVFRYRGIQNIGKLVETCIKEDDYISNLVSTKQNN